MCVRGERPSPGIKAIFHAFVPSSSATCRTGPGRLPSVPWEWSSTSLLRLVRGSTSPTFQGEATRSTRSLLHEAVAEISFVRAHALFMTVFNLRDLVPVALASTLATACGEVQRTTPTYVVEESLGITIVESLSARSETSEPAAVADLLLTQIGAQDSDNEGDQLHEVGHIRWLGDDRIVLSNAGTEVRVYDATGALLRTLGGRGQGPGDFSSIYALGVTTTHRIVVADLERRRITILDSLGNIESITQAEASLGRSPTLLGDRWLVGRIQNQAPPSGPRVERLEDSIVATDIRTAERAVWATVPGNYLSWVPIRDGISVPLGTGLTPIAQVVAQRGRVVFGSPDIYELRELNENGDLTRILRRRVSARLPTEEHIRPYITEWESRFPTASAIDPPLMDSLPHFSRLLLDDNGRTWAQVSEGGFLPAPDWDLFGPEGAYLGTVRFPLGFSPHAIRTDRALGLWRDELGVEYIQIRRLDLPAKSGGA